MLLLARAKRVFRRKRHPVAGAQPGTLVLERDAPPPRIHIMVYSAAGLEEHDISGVAALAEHLHEDRVTWVEVQGLGDERVLRAIADLFHLHVLALEDVTNVPQRPKVEAFEEHTFLIASMMMRGNGSTVEREQVSMFVGANWVLTFQERYEDVFDPVRARIRQGGPVLRASGPEYLAYALLDALIDGYYPVLETFGDHLEALESTLMSDSELPSVHAIYDVKRELLGMRRAVWPLREMLNTLLRDETPFITDRVEVHLRDCYDHCVQLIDVVETYRELAGGLMDLYLSSVANRQNEVMKTLTIMASIFIPLSFLAGVYGMNFDNMPELHYPWGYPAVLLVMAGVAGGMVTYFFRKGWIASGRTGRSGADGA